MHQKTAVSHCIVHWNILWNHKISTSNLICSVQWSHCTGARFVDGWVDNYRMPKICSCLPCDTKHGAQAQYGHMYSAYSVVMGGGAWHWPGTPHTIHTYTCCCCRTAEAAMLPRQQPVTVGGTVVQCAVHGTVWYSVVHTGRPTTDLCCRSLAAAERGAATASPLWATDAYPRIYISTHLTYLRGPGTGTFQTKSPQFGSMTCQFTCQHRQNMDVDVNMSFKLRNLLILVASSQMSKTNEIWH